MFHTIQIKQLTWTANQLTGFYIMGKLIVNTFTAGAIFRNPARNADDEFISHAEATSKMPMTYIRVISYPFRNDDDEITRHSGGYGFFFISTLRLIFTLISVHFVILVIFLSYQLKFFQRSLFGDAKNTVRGQEK